MNKCSYCKDFRNLLVASALFMASAARGCLATADAAEHFELVVYTLQKITYEKKYNKNMKFT